MGLIDKLKNIFGIGKKKKYKEKEIEIIPETATTKERIVENKKYESKKQDTIEIKPRVRKEEPKRTVSSVEKEIDNELLNIYNFEANSQNGLIAFNSGNIQNKYNKLLVGKVNDEKLKTDMIKHADLIIRKRITADLYLTGEEGTKTIITIIGVLPEDETSIVNYWIGKVIYNDIGQQCQSFLDTMRSEGKNIRGCISKSGNPIGKLTVNNIRATVTFK